MRDQFPYVVVDAGSSLARAGDLLLELADTIYLVTQVDVPSLRNANRLIASYGTARAKPAAVEVVLNRFEPRRLEIDEEHIAKALARPAAMESSERFRRRAALPEYRDAAGARKLAGLARFAPDGPGGVWQDCPMRRRKRDLDCFEQRMASESSTR